jgi:hypothetical protein
MPLSPGHLQGTYPHPPVSRTAQDNLYINAHGTGTLLTGGAKDGVNPKGRGLEGSGSNEKRRPRRVAVYFFPVAGLFGTEFLFYLGDSVGDSSDIAGLLIGNLDSENALEFHKELDGVERIGTQIVGEIGGLGHFGLFDTQFVNDDVFDLLYDFFVSHD